ncbi:DJ-1 family glyoxalase III [Fusobacterium sp.]|uniref:DJ-1 family glyoxalase III n=1 Tax=Fusobacterium sp. TaxID=68766 RepID=UPI0029027C5D|nr:DJ-1 family glyoxalase III [Fusobacterium sp.]MDU1911276.1 DJ-1/PfpI family protein [Fusobacterium sp.]
MKKVYILLADGFELIEALTPVDVLRRGGVDVKTVSITSEKNVMSGQEVLVKADTTLKETDLKDGDMLVLPGGNPGYINLGNSNEVVELIKFYIDNKKFVGAICGAPSILGNHNIALGKRVTCHTSLKELMKNHQYEEKNIVRDDKLITGMGAGQSLAFAFELAETLLELDTINKIKTGMEL